MFWIRRFCRKQEQKSPGPLSGDDGKDYMPSKRIVGRRRSSRVLQNMIWGLGFIFSRKGATRER